MSDPESLVDRHDALLVDLDGVVRLGDHVVPAAPDALERARAAGSRIVFVTNNAASTAADVASSLRDLGVAATDDEVLTSSMAAADELRRRLPEGAAVLVVGGDGLRVPVATAGLRPVATAEDEPAAVVQGWSPDLTWSLLAEAAVAVRRGLPWVATNRDATLPSARGPLPGNGAMIAAVVLATGREPDVVGKPEPALFHAAADAARAHDALVVGDRLDTDIAGACRAGMASLLVLSGVSSARDLLAAPPETRPTYVGRDLGAVHGPATAISDPSADARCVDDLSDLRAACRRAWSGELPPDQYDDVVQQLGLD